MASASIKDAALCKIKYIVCAHNGARVQAQHQFIRDSNAPGRLRAMYALLPELLAHIRLIVLLREPVARAISSFLAKGGNLWDNSRCPLTAGCLMSSFRREIAWGRGVERCAALRMARQRVSNAARWEACLSNGCQQKMTLRTTLTRAYTLHIRDATAPLVQCIP